jgi:hypothetical protein
VPATAVALVAASTPDAEVTAASVEVSALAASESALLPPPQAVSAKTLEISDASKTGR